MTTKQRQFVKKYIETGDKTAAALAVYDYSGSKNPKYAASAHAVELVKKLSIQELMEERQRLRDSDLLDTLKEGLKATKRVTSPTEPDSVDPDYQVRHRYLETGLKLKGHLREQNNTQVNVFNQLNIDTDSFNLT